MAATTPDKLARDLNANKLENIYCLFGEEPYLMDEALQAIIDRSLDGAPKDFNLDVFYAGQSNGSDVVDSAGTLPMMAQKRVVVLKEIQNLREKQTDGLLQLLEDPVDSTVLVFVGSKVDQRKKFFKTLSKKSAYVKFTRPHENQIPGWVNSIFAKEGKKILSDANGLLIQLVGPSLIDLHNEIQKVIQYVGDKEVVEWQDVEAIVPRVRAESVFDLANAIGRGDRAGAITYLVNLLDHGENEIGILALISRHIRLLLLSKEALSEGVPNNQLASRIGVPPYFVNQYTEQARRWSRPQLEKVHRLLLDTDRALKSAPVASHILLENLVLRSCDLLAVSNA